jgi:S1-C subfamily serine protease
VVRLGAIRISVLAVAALAALAVACGSGEAKPDNVAQAPQPAATERADSTPVASPTVAACVFEDSVSEIFAATAQVITDLGTGTAFRIGSDEFATAAHVVEGALQVRLVAPGWESDVEVAGLEAETDVAVLRTLSPPSEGAAIRWGDVASLVPGQLLGVAGYPTAVFDSPSVTSGRLSKVVEDPDLGFGTFLQTDAAVNPGNSGGAVFDECGLVVGMVVAKLSGISIEGVAWAVAETTLRSAIPRAVRKGPPEAVSLAGKSQQLDIPLTRFVANTGGSGVAVRSDCEDSARASGALSEGQRVSVVRIGAGACGGWSYVDTGGAVSWVRDGYLSESPPRVASAPLRPPLAPRLRQATRVLRLPMHDYSNGGRTLLTTRILS